MCPYAWDAAGGVQVHVDDLARQLVARGHDVAVLAPHDRGPGGRAAGAVLRVPYRGTVAPIAPSPLAIRRLSRVFARLAPDVVHVHEPLAPSTAMWATLASPAPVVATFHAFLDRSRAMELAAPLLRTVARRLAASIAVSEAAAAFLRRAVPELEPVVIPNGVDVAAFEGAEPAALPAGRRIAWIHRLDPQKGFGVALEAFSALVGDVPDARLVVGGEGRDRGLVEGLTEAVRSRVTMLGTVAHADVSGILRGSEAAIAPATGQESFGIAVVEAMAAGVPVVASDIAGYREVVRDRRDGLLVPPGDPAALAAGMRSILQDAGLASRLAEGGRVRARAYAWSTVVARLEEVYGQASAGPPPVR